MALSRDSAIIVVAMSRDSAATVVMLSKDSAVLSSRPKKQGDKQGGNKL